MHSRIIERALVCRLIDSYTTEYGLERPLTKDNLDRIERHVIELLTSFEVEAMYDESRFRRVDVESNEIYEVYAEKLVERFVCARLGQFIPRNEPLTEEHLRDLIGDFQDLVWNGYGDDAIQVD